MKMSSQSFGWMAACAVIISACATQPASLEAKSSVKLETELVNADQISIRAIKDNRPKNAELSDMYGRPMSGTNFMEWFENSLQANGLYLNGDAAAEDAACQIDLEIRRAEVKSKNTSKSATVVIGARDIRSDDYALYRGVNTGMNWAGGQGETNNALSRALHEALLKLDEACKA